MSFGFITVTNKFYFSPPKNCVIKNVYVPNIIGGKIKNIHMIDMVEWLP